MAKEEKHADGAAEAAPKKSKKMLIIILAAVLVLVLVGGGAAFFLLKKSSDHGEGEEAAAEQESAKKKGGKEHIPVYIPMEPFTVNLVPETGDQYLQITINVEAVDAGVGEKLKIHLPKLRNKIVLILSSKKPSELTPREGKEQLAEELKEAINAVIGGEPAKGKKAADEPIKEVLFTSFIIQ